VNVDYRQTQATDVVMDLACLDLQLVRSLSRSATRSSNTCTEMHDSRICNESVSPWSRAGCVAISGSRTSRNIGALLSRGGSGYRWPLV